MEKYGVVVVFGGDLGRSGRILGKLWGNGCAYGEITCAAHATIQCISGEGFRREVWRGMQGRWEEGLKNET